MTSTISAHQALIYIMVTMSAVDRVMGERELKHIGRLVKHLPVFKGFDKDQLPRIALECAEILQQESGGLQAILGLVKEAVPEILRETAYAVASEVAAADLMVAKEELRLLALLRDALGLSKLITAALERSVIARHRSG